MNGTGLRGFNARRRLYILPEWRTVYVSVPKNACTSLKWLVAAIAGEDENDLRREALTFSPTRAGLIHNRKAWRKVAPLSLLDDELLASIDPEDGWFVFAVVRDPRLRLFSAWQDKYLLRSPGYWRRWESQDVPRTTEDVVTRFRRFVLDVASTDRHPALNDGHFFSQVWSLNEHLVPYSRIYDMSQLSELMVDLGGHLAAQGHDSALTLGRSNRSPFEARSVLFDEEVLEATHSLYAGDFARFEEFWDKDAPPGKVGEWTPDAFSHAGTVISMNERIADLVRLGRKLRDARPEDGSATGLPDEDEPRDEESPASVTLASTSSG